MDANHLGLLLDGYEIDKETSCSRQVSLFMDTILGWQFKIHNHGFVRVVDYMGTDAAIVQAARVSYGEGTTTKSSDDGLIRYLIENKHTSPIEQVRIKFHLKMPIFVARQHLRHRMASVNEYSGRYSIMGDEVYIPAPEFINVQSADNKQGRGQTMSAEDAQKVTDILNQMAESSQKQYHDLLDLDLTRELARIGLGLNTYTEFYWTIDLHNLFHFLNLRLHPHAQKEIRDYAEVILLILRGWVPSATAAFENFILNGMQLSDAAQRYLRHRINAPYDLIPMVPGMSSFSTENTTTELAFSI